MNEATTTYRSSERAWLEVFTPEERRSLLATNNWRSWLSIGLDWGIVAVSFWLVAIAPNPLTIVVAIALIGCRQLGFAVMMHEAAHHTLFKNRTLNDLAGNWLCAYPIWADLHPYRGYHLKHHAKNWTDEDPDLDLATKYPVTAASMKRKLWRDISGQVGWKRARAILKRDLGGAVTKTRRSTSISFGKTANTGSVGWRNLRGVVITNLVLLAILAAFGAPELYLLWVAAWFTTNSLVTRIRSISEHNMPGDPTNELQNSRTMLARWWERLLIAPNRVNYHLEHHLLMTVPFFNLHRMHRILMERESLDGALIETGYVAMVRRAAARVPA
ncbi:MAG: fatty acid desaturase family protein [Myxococcales bacterium]|nr:fatty acid desaturase family protein [Myxococcales bacterium]